MSTIDDLMTKFAAARAKYAQEPVPPPTFDEMAASVERNLGRKLAPNEGFISSETHPVSLAQTRTEDGGVRQPYQLVRPSSGPAAFIPSVMNPSVEGSILSGGPATIGDQIIGGYAGMAAAQYLNPSVRIATDPRNYSSGKVGPLSGLTPGAAARFYEPMLRGNPTAVSLQPRTSAPVAVQTQAGKNQPAITRNQVASNLIEAARQANLSIPGVSGGPLARPLEPNVSLITQRPPVEGPITALKNLPGIRPREMTPLPSGSLDPSAGNLGQRLRTVQQIPGPRAGAGRYAPLIAGAAGFMAPAIYNKLYGSQYITPEGPTTSFFPTITTAEGVVERPAPSMLNPLNWFR